MRKRLICLTVLAALVVPMVSVPQKPARACFISPCLTCPTLDPETTAFELVAMHQVGETLIIMWTALQFNLHRMWLTDIFFRQQVLPALQKMTEQMTVVAMQQVQAIGMFLDAKQQLETQRLFQELQAEAHKDYQPSEDFCWFGTNVRSLAASEQTGHYNSAILGTRSLQRQLGTINTAGAEGRDSDKSARWAKFITTYCDPDDNNRTATTGTGLTLACGASGGGSTARVNIDVDYTRAIDEKRTLDLSFANAGTTTPDGEDVMALSDNLYGHDVLRRINGEYLKNEEYQHLYMALRSVAAKRSVAQNSFNAIVGLKSSGTSDPGNGTTTNPNEPKTREFLGAVMTELGVPPSEVYQIIGERPSYYAQLEILAKKIYQNPDFYSNLYDKPANVKRKSVALKAIDLMLDRAIYESQLRQEMALSVLLSAKLHKKFGEVNERLK